MKLQLKEAVKLFENLGFSTAPRWSKERLERKIDGLPDVIDEDTDAGESQQLLDDLLICLDNEDEVVIQETETEVEEVPVLNESTEEEPEEEEPEEEEPEEEKVESTLRARIKTLEAEVEELSKALAKAKKSGSRKVKKRKKKVGVISTIIDFLNEATEENPITKEGLHKRLVEKFPDRSYAGMMATVSSQVPSRLISDKGLEVEKNENGFWIS